MLAYSTACIARTHHGIVTSVLAISMTRINGESAVGSLHRLYVACFEHVQAHSLVVHAMWYTTCECACMSHSCTVICMTTCLLHHGIADGLCHLQLAALAVSCWLEGLSPQQRLVHELLSNAISNQLLIWCSHTHLDDTLPAMFGPCTCTVLPLMHGM